MTTQALLSTTQLNKLQEEYAQLKTIPVEAAKDLFSLIDKLSIENLQILSKANIKFLSKVARGRLLRKN